MAKQMTPAQMKAAFTKWKVPAKYYPNWETRGYGPGSITDAEGIVIHHTGSDAGQSDAYLDFLFNQGRPDVPAPLCNFSTDMDGDFWVGAAERANHAGRGSSATLAKVKSGNYDWRNVTIHPGADDLTGNSYYYGNECRFDGGQPMTPAMWRSVILSCAAICDFHGWGAWRVIGHKEHTTRKTDPGNTLMYMIRRDVAAALTAGPGNWPTKTGDDEMTPAQMTELKNYIHSEVYAGPRYAALQGSLNAVGNAVSAVGTAVAAVLPYLKTEDAANDADLKAKFDQLTTHMATLEADLAKLQGPTPPKA
jgi:hypothetical protein